MGTRCQGFSSDDSWFPAAVSDDLPKGCRSRPGAGAAKRPGSVRDSTRSAQASAERSGPSRLLLGLGLAAALVLWAGSAAGQSTVTFTATHTGSATVTDGRIQLVEGGASTTFQIDLPDDFLTTLKAAHPEAERPGARFGALLYIIRDSPDVTWDTTSGSTYKDRTAEYTISYNGTEIQPRYSAASQTLPERTWVYIPLTGTPPGSTSSYAGVDDFAASSFPITFTIKAESDTTYLEEESFRLRGRFVLSGSQATPTFTSIRFNSNDLIFDLVEAALPDPTGKPTTPANFMATAGKGAVTLTWDAIDDTSSNTNLVNDVQIIKHQVRQTTDSDITDDTWEDIPNSAYGEINAASYTIGSLTDGTEYTFQVRAVNGCTETTGCGESEPATAVMATPDADALARPTGLAVTPGNTQITLTWDDPDDASVFAHDYQVKEEGAAAFGAWTTLPYSSVTDHAARLTGLTNGTTYVYRIRARAASRTSLSSDAATATPQGAAPAAPVLTITARYAAVTLNWPDPEDASVTGYDYQYKVGGAAYHPWMPARERSASDCGGSTAVLCIPPYVELAGNLYRFPVGDLENGTTYTFRVRANNRSGATVSNTVTITPVAAVPAKLTGVETGLTPGVSPNRFLRWDDHKDPSITGYEFSTDNGRTWVVVHHQGLNIAPLPGDQRFAELPDDDLKDESYRFRVRAKNDHGAGPASEEAKAVSFTGLEQGELLRRTVRVEWDGSAGTATLVWDATESTIVRWWQVQFFDNAAFEQYETHLPIATTRYKIPATLTAGTSFGVSVTGCRVRDCQTSAIDKLSVVLGAPAVPTGLTATPGDDEVTLAWDDPMDASITKYQYWYQGHGNRRGSWRDIPDGDDADMNAGNETSHTVSTGLTNGAPYQFRLRAMNTHGTSGEAEATPPSVTPFAIGVPAAPSGLAVAHAGPSARVIWNDPHDGSITGYQWLSFETDPRAHPLGRSFSDHNREHWMDIPGSSAGTTGYMFTLGEHFGRISIAIRAKNGNGVGPRAMLDGVPESPTPARPTGLTATPGNGRVTLAWDDPGEDVFINGYRYTLDDGATWNEIPNSRMTLQGHLTRYTVQNLTNGQPYTFSLQAWTSEVHSFVTTIFAGPVSDPVTATPLAAAPAKPAGLRADPGDTEVTLAWDAAGDASITKYQVKQGTAAWADISGSGAAPPAIRSAASPTARRTPSGSAP